MIPQEVSFLNDGRLCRYTHSGMLAHYLPSFIRNGMKNNPQTSWEQAMANIRKYMGDKLTAEASSTGFKPTVMTQDLFELSTSLRHLWQKDFWRRKATPEALTSNMKTLLAIRQLVDSQAVLPPRSERLSSFVDNSRNAAVILSRLSEKPIPDAVQLLLDSLNTHGTVWKRNFFNEIFEERCRAQGWDPHKVLEQLMQSKTDVEPLSSLTPYQQPSIYEKAITLHLFNPQRTILAVQMTSVANITSHAGVLADGLISTAMFNGWPLPSRE